MKCLWLLASLAAILTQCKGLEFSLNRNKQGLSDDSSTCATLVCEVKSQPPKVSREGAPEIKSSSTYGTISSMIIFKKTSSLSGDKSAEQMLKIASVETSKTNFQQEEDGIKGYGHLAAGYAMVRLQLRKNSDCHSDFFCQVEGIDSEGREKVSTSHIVQQSQDESVIEGDSSGLSTSVTMQVLSLVQQIAVKMALVERSQEGLDSQMNVLEHRLQDKIDTGFQQVENKLWELESKVSSQGSGRTPVKVENVNSQTLDDILNSAKRLEDTLRSLNASMQSESPTCEQVVRFLAENLTAEMNEFANNREDLIEAVEDQMAQLSNDFDTGLRSLEETVKSSTAMVPNYLSKLLDNLNSTALNIPFNSSVEKLHNLTCKKGEVPVSPLSSSYPYPIVYPSKGSISDKPFLCDMITDGGGWIVIQRRATGDTDFFRGWDEYKEGFGTLDTDFWMGNEMIHDITRNGAWELRVDMKYGGKSYYALYSSFSVGDESSNYKLDIGSYSGTAGDSLTRHRDHPFSTKDKDNDDGDTRNCAATFEGAWWYINCHDSNLNGRWMSTTPHHGLMWRSKTQSGSVEFSQMAIRQVPM